MTKLGRARWHIKMHITKPITALWDWQFDVLMTLGQNKDRFIMQDQSKLNKHCAIVNCKC